jgi:hypothetical protein
VFATLPASLLVVGSSTLVVLSIGCLADVVVVVDSVALAVANCSGLSVDAELTHDHIAVTFTNYALANTIDTLFK